MCQYKHLSTKEREVILCGIMKCHSISKIAEELGRNKSTISRELKVKREQKGTYGTKVKLGIEKETRKKGVRFK